MNKKKVKQIIEIAVVVIIIGIAGYNLYNKLIKEKSEISKTEDENKTGNKKKIQKKDAENNNQNEKPKKDIKDTNKDIKTYEKTTENSVLEIKRDIFQAMVKTKQNPEEIEESKEQTKKVYSKLNINGVIKTSKNKNAIVLESGEIINEGEKIREYTLLKIQGDTAYLVTEDWDVIKISIWEENNEK